MCGTFRKMSVSAVTQSEVAGSRTVNQDEVNKFRYVRGLLGVSGECFENCWRLSHFRVLSDKWWDPNGPLSGLHSMNTLRVPFIRDGLVQTGAASGSLAEPLDGLVRLCPPLLLTY